MFKMKRRKFVALTTAGVLGAVTAKAESSSLKDVKVPRIKKQKSDQLSIGSWAKLNSTETAHQALTQPELAGKTPWQLQSKAGNPMLELDQGAQFASGLSKGDPEFLQRGVRVTIYGPEPLQETWANEGIKHFSLWGRTVPLKRAPKVPPVLLWRFEHNEARIASSSPISYTASIDDSGLVLYSDLDRDGDGWHSLRFTMDNDPDWPSLQRGAYLIGLASGRQATLPDWSAYGWHASDEGDQGERKYLFTKRGTGLELAMFPYLVVVIDYAS